MFRDVGKTPPSAAMLSASNADEGEPMRLLGESNGRPTTRDQLLQVRPAELKFPSCR
jgi:hypothetical protein